MEIVRLALRVPIPGHDHLEILVGAGSIETAAGLSPQRLAELSTIDRAAIWKAMK